MAEKSKDINSPDTLEVHRPNFHHMSDLLALENAISSPPSHARHVEQLGAIYHVVVWGEHMSTSEFHFSLAGIIPSRLATQTPLAST